MKDVKKADVVALIDRIRRHAPVLANRTLALLLKFFNWCLGRDYIELNPALGIPRPKKEVLRDRVLSLSEMQTIFAASSQLSNGNQLLVKFMLLTGQRESVIARLEQSEVRGDHLEIQRDRNKSGERIRVPLSPIAQQLIEELGSREGRYVVSIEQVATDQSVAFLSSRKAGPTNRLFSAMADARYVVVFQLT